MQIFLIRHGDAELEADSDALRMLSSRGKADCWNIARQLSGRQGDVDTMLVSPYLRARQTAEQLANVVSISNIKESEDLLPEAEVSRALNLVQACQADSVIVVSHNPLVSRLLSLIVEGSKHAEYYLATSQLVCVDAEVPGPGCGSIRYELLP